jgi:hypothetical protein
LPLKSFAASTSALSTTPEPSGAARLDANESQLGAAGYRILGITIVGRSSRMPFRAVADRDADVAVQYKYPIYHLVEQIERIMLAVDDLGCRDLLS